MSLSETHIEPALTGDKLITAIAAAKERRKPLIEGLIYESTSLMVSADPGTGKSTIATQVMLEAAAGLPVFGVLHVPRPLKCLFAQTERDILELLERLEHFSKIYPIIKENIIVTDEYQRFNMLNPDHVNLMIKCMKRDCPDGVDLTFFDPIYPMVSGGLSKDEPASAWCHAMDQIQKELGGSHWYGHHTVKPEYVQGVKYVRDDPFYGSQWLKAHCTGGFFMDKTEKGVKMVLKKDNYNILSKEINLEYNSETGISLQHLDNLPGIERVKNFISLKLTTGSDFYFDEMVKATGLCTRECRELIMHSSIKSRLLVVSSIRNKHLYRVLPST